MTNHSVKPIISENMKRRTGIIIGIVVITVIFNILGMLGLGEPVPPQITLVVENQTSQTLTIYFDPNGKPIGTITSRGQITANGVWGFNNLIIAINSQRETIFWEWTSRQTLQEINSNTYKFVITDQMLKKK